MNTINSSQILDDCQGLVLVDTTSGDVTLTLSSVSLFDEKRYTIKIISGTNDVVINADSGETIDGDSSYTLSGLNSVIRLVSNGGGWYII